MKVILDNGHGRDTAGKRSPDGRLREYAYTREMARRIAQDLKRQESVRRTFRIADTPGIGAVGGLRLRDQFVFQQLLRSSGK